MVEVQLSCASCGSTIRASAHNVQKVPMQLQSGRSVWLTYLDCPHCSERIFVQADDEHSNGLLETETELMAKVLLQKRQGIAVRKKQLAKQKRLDRDLAVTRKELMTAIEGETAVDPRSGVGYVVTFNEVVKA